MSLEKFFLVWASGIYDIQRLSSMWGNVFKHLFSLSLMAGIMPWRERKEFSLKKLLTRQRHRQTMTGQKLILDGPVKLSKKHGMPQNVSRNIQCTMTYKTFFFLPTYIIFYNLFLWWVLEINDDIVFIPSCRTLSEKLISFFKPHDIQFV